MQMLDAIPSAPPVPLQPLPTHFLPRGDARRWRARPAAPSATPQSSQANGSTFVATHLGSIQRAILLVCRQRKLLAEEAEELTSTVYVKLLEDDGAVLKKFRGDSQLATFLVVVINRILLDVRVARWGKWRPSVEAVRLGPVARTLEWLVYGQRLRFQEAAECLRQQFAGAVDDEQVRGLLARLPQRIQRRVIGADELERLPAPGPSTGDRMPCGSTRRATEALVAAVAGLSQAERELLRLRFTEGLRMSEIGRRLGVELKAIYREFDRILKRLRTDLERSGLTAEDVRGAFLHWERLRG